MKRTLFFLFIAAIPASAQDYSTVCCEGRGRVHNWPGVRQARYEAELCEGEMMALIGRQQMALTNATSSYRFQPYYSMVRTVPTLPMAAPSLPSPPRRN